MTLLVRSRRIASLLLLVSLALPLASCWNEKQPATWKMATGPEALEKLMWDEIKAKNWAEIERHIGPTFAGVGPRGGIDRAAFMEHAKQFEIDDFALGNVDSKPNGNDVMVTYDITIHGRLGGQPLPATPFHMMSVWQQVKGGWIEVAHATVPSGAPAQ
jgi:hypothetical protein